jgi:hypothetical protein
MSGAAAESDTPAPIAAAAAAGFGALSRLRGARIFHPEGVGDAGTLRVGRSHAEYPGVPFLEHAGEYPALFRLSRGVGLPRPLPDILGLAVRLTDVHGPGRHQDFLLVSSVDLPVLHHLLLPTRRGFLGQSFSSVLAYRVAGRLRLVGAQPMARGELRYSLALAPLLGRWTAVGDLVLGERLPDEDTERLAFNPWNTGAAMRPTGPFMGVRRAAYRGSQANRGLRREEIP